METRQRPLRAAGDRAVFERARGDKDGTRTGRGGGASRRQFDGPDAQRTAAYHRSVLESALGSLSGLGAADSFSWFCRAQRRRVGAQVEWLFAATGSFGADGHIGGDAVANRAAIYFFRHHRKISRF